MANQEAADPSDLLNPWEKNFRTRMREVRESSGLNQTDLARRVAARGLAFHQQTIQRIEAGVRPVRLNEAIAIASELGLPLDTMTAPLGASQQAVEFDIQRMRRACGREAEAVSEILGELAEQVGPLVVICSEMLETPGDPASRQLLAYAFKWLNKIWDAHVHLFDGWYLLTSIDDGRESDQNLSLPEFEAMATWWDSFDFLFAETSDFPSIDTLADDDKT